MTVIAVPKEIIRSSIFCVRQLSTQNRPKITKDIEVWHKKTKIRLIGEELNQSDCTAFYACLAELHKRNAGVGDRIDTSISELLSNCGLTRNSDSTRAFTNSLRRMRNTVLQITKEGIEYEGSILTTTGKGRRGCMFTLNERYGEIFSEHGNAFIDIKKRQQITSYVGRWLHDFILSHRSINYEIAWKNVKNLCGSGTDEAELHRLSRKGMEQLLEIRPDVSLRASIGKRGIVPFESFKDNGHLQFTCHREDRGW